MVTNYKKIIERLDVIISNIKVPMRYDKSLSEEDFSALMKLIREVTDLYKNEENIPKYLVGEFVALFASMLTEASYAQPDRKEIILTKAWEYYELVEKMIKK